MNQLEALRKLTTVVADTGDFDTLAAFKPTDSTTNPSLILAASEQTKYAHLIKEAVDYAKKNAHSDEEKKALVLDKVFVNFGLEILKIIPGRVSTEVDARLSFDVEGSISKAKKLIALYESAGISRERILIKLASTWEGAVAAKQLEKEGIHCNMTLMFSLPQAIICAEAGATLISPFVGRIFDWYKKKQGVDHYPPEKDPGVLSVTEIYTYYKKFDYPTQIMGASFRNIEEIIELAGCDLLTISPKLLDELKHSEAPLSQKLSKEKAKKASIEKQTFNEKSFRFALNENEMATEKLSEGIRKFSEDIVKLETSLMKKF